MPAEGSVLGRWERLRAMSAGLHLEILAGKAVDFKFASPYTVAGHLHLLVDGFCLVLYKTQGYFPVCSAGTQFPCVT